MPPFAGQGMCSGIRDAHNLAWKLAAAIHHDHGAPNLLATYQVEREPNVRSIVGLAMMMGRTVCMLDPEMARARDVQMITARAADESGPRPPSTPPLSAGCLLVGAAAAGQYFAQVPAASAGGGRLDDVLGPTAWLIAQQKPLPKDDAFRSIALDDPAIAAFRAELAAWLDKRDAPAVLVRADRYVFRTGTADALAAAWLALLSDGTAASPFTEASPTKENIMSLDGTYDVTVKSPLGEQKGTLTVKTDGDTFTGTNAGANGTFDVRGEVSGNTLTWQQAITTPMPMTLDMTATIDGDTLTGTAKAGAFGSFPMNGVRAA